ncbi:MAG: hypothetical protein J2P27_06040 [Actinobacteria bacterium]|nr:hypothetical protein [Actinomycetota bacterium]
MEFGTVFLVYVLLLIITGIALLVMASVRSGQTKARKLWTAAFGAGVTIYGVYLLLFFPGGRYVIFYYVFILPITLIVDFFRSRAAPRSRRPVGTFRDPQPDYDLTQPGYRQPQPGYRQPQPRYELVQPRYELVQPRYELIEPRYELLEPGYGRPERVYSRPPRAFRRRPRRR